MSRHLILGTAGHVDHGKTALIKALTGIDCDTHKEEKERGITINLGFAHLTLPSGESVGIVDVPGHKDFIRTMVAGAYGIDLVLLVIAADSGIMPQTTEHMQILRLLGIRHGIIALTKSDLVDDETLELAKLEVMEFLEGTPLEEAPAIAVSSVTGDGLAMLLNEMDALVSRVPERTPGPVFRMYIDRLFNIKGQGYVVTGTVMNGSAETGQELFLLPGFNKKLKIRQIERHGQTVPGVYAGDRAALNLAGITPDDFERGVVLSNQLLSATQMIDASLELFAKSLRLELWTQTVFYTGTFISNAKIHLLDRTELAQGETALVQVHLDKPAILLNGDHFIIRNTSNDRTLGGGIILDTNPLHHKRRTRKLEEYLTDMREPGEGTSETGWIRIELRKATGPLPAETLAAKRTIPVEELIRTIHLVNDPEVRSYSVNNKELLIIASTDAAYRDKVLRIITQWHEANPLINSGLDTRSLSGKLGLKTDIHKLYLDGLLASLQQEGTVRLQGSTWMLSSFTVKVDPQMKEALEWLDKTIEGYGLQKSVATEMDSLTATAQTRGISRQKLTMFLNYLVREGKIHYLEEDYIHRTVVDRCRRLLLTELSGKEAGINEKEFRLMIDGTKRIVQTLIGIFVNEGSITKQTFYLRITEKGKDWLHSSP